MASRPACCGVRRRGLVLEERARDAAGDLLEPERLQRDSCRALVEQQRAEAIEARLQRRLAIGLPEELRVAQPRRQHALGVDGDGAGVVGLDVGDGEERRQQAAGVVGDREVVLVMDHRRRQHFLRQVEELGGERPGDDRRVLHQVDDFLEQAGVAGAAGDAAAEAPRVRVELAGDARVPLLALEQHEVLAQLGPVVGHRAHLEGAAGAAAAGQHAVAVGHRAGAHVLDDGDAATLLRRITNGTTRPPCR